MTLKPATVPGGLLRFELVRYLVVGILLVLLYASILLLISDVTGIPAGLASVVATIVSIPVAYLGQRHFTFRSRGQVQWQFPAFALLAVSCIPMSAGVVTVLVDLLGAHPFVGGLIASALQPVYTYVMQKKVIFRRAAVPLT